MDKVAMELVERLESAASTLERTLSGLEERQRLLSGEVERISATVETSRREEELADRLAAAEREIEQLRAGAASVAASGARGTEFPKALHSLRRTLPASTAEMLAKHGIGDRAVDVRSLDAALNGLSLEQRIAVKSQLRRAGAMA